MGLDNIWRLPEGVEHPTMSIVLYGGMFSGPGKDTCESFRGKVYSDFIEDLSGISLYQDSIEGEDLAKILSSLKQFKELTESLPPGYRLLKLIYSKLPNVSEDNVDLGIEGLDDLITMFSKYSSIPGAKLVSWY